MPLLSFQSHVVMNPVGHGAALPILNRLGIEAWPVHVLQFSNHPGLGAPGGMVFPAEHLASVIDSITAQGGLSRVNAVLTGYLGSAENAHVALDTLLRVRALNAKALYACDPVLGDAHKGLYVRPALAEFIRDRLVPHADLVTPNLFEMGWLTGAEITTREALLLACRSLHARGLSTILVTSADLDDTPDACTDLVLSRDGEVFRLRMPRYSGQYSGAGDALMALFLGRMLKGEPPERAFEMAGRGLNALIRRSATAGTGEIALMASLDDVINPPEGGTLERLA